MKKKMPGKAVISMMLALVLVLGATIGVFASDYIAQDTTYGNGLTVDGTTGWNTADGDRYLVTTHGTTVSFTNAPFQTAAENYYNFIVETVSSSDADGVTMRADAASWTYGEGINTPAIEVTYNWDWADFQTICTDNTEITLTATKTSDTAVVFDILFGTSGYEEVYTVTYPNGTPNELWFSVGTEGGTVTINSVDYVNITNVTLDSISITEYISGTRMYVDGTVITVSYEDGTTETLTYDDSAYVQDADGNYIHLYAEHLTDGYFGYDNGDQLYYTGSYGIYFSVSDSQENWVLTTATTEEAFVVRDIDTAYLESLNAQEMTIDTTYEVEIDAYCGSDWFTFTPENSGYYAFESSDNSGYTQGNEYYWLDPYAYVYYVNTDGDVVTEQDDDDGDENNFKVVMYLESGTTYYLRAYTFNGGYVGVYSVEVSENTVITALSVPALSQTEFTQYAEYFDLTGTVVTVTYSDGTTADLTIDGYNATDDYGNEVCYYFTYTFESGGNTWSYSYGYGTSFIGEGTYEVCVYDTLTGACDVTQSITVTSLADYEGLTEIELLDEAYEVTGVESGVYDEYDVNTWFTFTPEDTSNYYFVVEATAESEFPADAMWCSEASQYSNVYYLEDGNRKYVSAAYNEETYETLYDESGKYKLYTLTEGVTYYISVSYECSYYLYVEETGIYEWYGIPGDISVTAQEVNHTHTYANAVIDWTWSEDHSTATAVLRCDTCSYTETVTATGEAITSVTTEATAATDGSIVYTATVTINGVAYVSEPVTVVIPATGEPAADPANPAADPADPAASPSSSSTPTISPDTGDVSTVVCFAVLLCAAAAIAVIAKKKVNA